jgi:MOSC domain-containing protein YiiM
VLEVVKVRTGCSRPEAAQGTPIAGLGPVGVMARVISGGLIRPGDPVAVVEVTAAR